MAYLLDANVLIAARKLHYGFDFCPGFWDWLIAANESGHVFSVEKVGEEVLALKDDLSNWAAARGDRFFLRPDASILAGHLAAIGHRVTVFHRTATKAEQWIVEHAGESATSLAEAAVGAEFVFCCVRNDDDVTPES